MDNIISAFISAKSSDIINFTNDCCSQSRGNQFTLGRESFLQYGCRLQFSQQSVVYLGWQDGKITIMPYLTTENIISFPFSGCLFGTFLYDNVAYAVHIATSSCATSDMRNKWENFCKINRTHMTDIKIYKPNKCLVNDYLQVWGIISNTGNFYSTGIGKRKRNKNKDEDKRCFYIEQSANVFQGCQAYTNCYQLIDWQTNKNKRIFKR